MGPLEFSSLTPDPWPPTSLHGPAWRHPGAARLDHRGPARVGARGARVRAGHVGADSGPPRVDHAVAIGRRAGRAIRRAVRRRGAAGGDPASGPAAAGTTG